MSRTEAVSLLSNATATGAGKSWPGGMGVFSVAATFSGATIKLQFLGPDGATWLDVGSGVTLTSAGAGGFYLHPCVIRAAVSGSPTGAYAQAQRVFG